MRHLRHVGTAVLALLVVAASSAAAQRQGTRARGDGGFWELGTDAGIGIGLDDPKSLSLDIPLGSVRAGYYLSDVLSFEPSLAFHSFAAKGLTGSSFWALGLGLVYNMTAERNKKQLFAHPVLGFIGGSGGQRTVTSLGFGIGVKNPILQNRLATRVEANFTHTLKSGSIPATTSLNGFFGLSFYTK